MTIFSLTTDQDDFSVTTDTEFNAPATNILDIGTRTIPSGATRTIPTGTIRTFVYILVANTRPILLTTEQDDFNLTTEQ